MGFFNNLFGNNKNQNNKLSDLLIDYSLKFNNAILSSYDTSQIDQTYLNNLKLESYAFTYQVIDNLSLDNYNKVRKYAFDIGAGAQRSVFDLHP